MWSGAESFRKKKAFRCLESNPGRLGKNLGKNRLGKNQES